MLRICCNAHGSDATAPGAMIRSFPTTSTINRAIQKICFNITISPRKAANPSRVPFPRRALSNTILSKAKRHHLFMRSAGKTHPNTSALPESKDLRLFKFEVIKQFRPTSLRGFCELVGPALPLSALYAIAHARMPNGKG